MTETVTLTVPSHPRHLYVIRSVLYPLAVGAGFTKKDARQIVLAVDEACSNVIKHAYDGDSTKTITITVQDSFDRFVVQIRDYGKKVDTSAIAPRKLDDIRPGGLGTHFMSIVFDTMDYDTAFEQGTLLTLGKKKQQVSA